MASKKDQIWHVNPTTAFLRPGVAPARPARQLLAIGIVDAGALRTRDGFMVPSLDRSGGGCSPLGAPLVSVVNNRQKNKRRARAGTP
jgi:hypothetical protein